MSKTDFKESRIITDRTKANSKTWLKSIIHNLKWCKQNGLDFIIRSDRFGSHSIYIAHEIENNVKVEKAYWYLTSSQTLEGINSILHNYAVLIQSYHLTEFKDIKNKQTVKLHLEVFDNCFECGLPLDKNHKVSNDPYQNCLMKGDVKN